MSMEGCLVIIQTNKELRPRDENDYYPTPLPFAKSALDLLPDSFSPRHIIDPGDGDGVWGIEARQKWPKAIISGVEVRDVPKPAQYNYWYNSAYQKVVTRHTVCDLVMGNPPFKYAEEFVRYSLQMIAPGGYLVFFLRLAFLESQTRLKLWRDCPPRSVVVCANRPSFTGDKKTDATAYAFYIWERGHVGGTQLQWTYINTQEQATLFERIA